MTRVARAFGQSPSTVLDWPWHEVLLAWYGLEEVERIDTLVDDIQRVQGGFLMNYAFNAPKRLEQEQRALRARLTAGDREQIDEAAIMREALAFADHLKSTTEGKG